MKLLKFVLPLVASYFCSCSLKNYHEGKSIRSVSSYTYSMNGYNRYDSVPDRGRFYNVIFNEDGDTLSYENITKHGPKVIKKYDYEVGNKRVIQTEDGKFTYSNNGFTQFIVNKESDLPEFENLKSFVFNSNGLLVEARTDTTVGRIPVSNCFEYQIKSIETRFYYNSIYDYTSKKEFFLKNKKIGERFFNEKQENYKTIFYRSSAFIDSLIYSNEDFSHSLLYKNGEMVGETKQCNIGKNNYYFDYSVGRHDSIVYRADGDETIFIKYSNGKVVENGKLGYSIYLIDLLQKQEVAQYATKFDTSVRAFSIDGELLFGTPSCQVNAKFSDKLKRYIPDISYKYSTFYPLGKGFHMFYSGNPPKNQGSVSRSKEWVLAQLSNSHFNKLLPTKYRKANFDGVMGIYLDKLTNGAFSCQNKFFLEDINLSDTSSQLVIKWRQQVGNSYSVIKNKTDTITYYKKDFPDNIPALKPYDNAFTSKDLYYITLGNGDYMIKGMDEKRILLRGIYNHDHSLISEEIVSCKTEYITKQDSWGKTKETIKLTKEKIEGVWKETRKEICLYDYKNGLLIKETLLDARKVNDEWVTKTNREITYSYNNNIITKETCSPSDEGRCSKQIFNYEYFEK